MVETCFHSSYFHELEHSFKDNPSMAVAISWMVMLSFMTRMPDLIKVKAQT